MLKGLICLVCSTGQSYVNSLFSIINNLLTLSPKDSHVSSLPDDILAPCAGYTESCTRHRNILLNRRVSLTTLLARYLVASTWVPFVIGYSCLHAQAKLICNKLLFQHKKKFFLKWDWDSQSFHFTHWTRRCDTSPFTELHVRAWVPFPSNNTWPVFTTVFKYHTWISVNFST